MLALCVLVQLLAVALAWTLGASAQAAAAAAVAALHGTQHPQPQTTSVPPPPQACVPEYHDHPEPLLLHHNSSFALCYEVRRATSVLGLASLARLGEVRRHAQLYHHYLSMLLEWDASKGTAPEAAAAGGGGAGEPAGTAGAARMRIEQRVRRHLGAKNALLARARSELAKHSANVSAAALQRCLLARLDTRAQPPSGPPASHPSPPASPYSSAGTSAVAGSNATPPSQQQRQTSKPLVSLLVQYFDRAWMLPQLVSPFKRCSETGRHRMEMLLNVDSVRDAEEVAAFAAASGGFVVPVFSNNVHEIRAYNRLARLARGKILVMLQDDDLFPEEDGAEDGATCRWIEGLVASFFRWPRLGAVGSQRFVYDYHPNTTVEGMQFEDDGAGMARAPVNLGPAAQGRRLQQHQQGGQRRPQATPFQFVAVVDYAPIAVRKVAFEAVGGIDEGMSEAGMCGVHSDYDLVLRMWLAGWQVAYMEVPGLAKDPKEEEGGTHRKGVFAYCWERQWELAIGYMESRWGKWNRWEPGGFYWFGSLVSEVVSEHVRQLNLRMLRLTAEACPFGYGCGLSPALPQRPEQ